MFASRRRPPQQIGGSIQALLSRLDSEGHFEIVRLVRLWPEVVGEAIARRTEVVGLKFHSAVVKVSGAMWIQELNLMKPQNLREVHTSGFFAALRMTLLLFVRYRPFLSS